MTERSIIHDTFALERTYPASPSRVFAAFASKEAKDAWGDTGDIAEAEPAAARSNSTSWSAGRAIRFAYQGVNYTYDVEVAYRISRPVRQPSGYRPTAGAPAA
jgi:uncharacterized protein YndB with AHSA1/START domain